MAQSDRKMGRQIASKSFIEALSHHCDQEPQVVKPAQLTDCEQANPHGKAYSLAIPISCLMHVKGNGTIRAITA